MKSIYACLKARLGAHEKSCRSLHVGGLDWINARDPLYFWGCGIPYIYVKGSPIFPRVMWAK